MTFWQIVKFEISMIFSRKSRTAFYLLAFPLLYVVLFGGVYMTNMVQYIPTVVYDQDQSGTSRILTQAFEDSEKYHIVAYVDSDEEMNNYLKNKDAKVAVVIPPRFAQDIKLGKASQVLVIANGVNILIANSVIPSASEIVQTVTAGVSKKLIEAAGQLPDEALNKAAAVQIRLRILDNPTYGYNDFILPGLVLTSLQVGIILAICASLSCEYRQLKKWQGVPTIKLVLGKLFPYWLFGVLAYVLSLILIVAVFEVPVKGAMLQLLLCGAAFIFCIVGVGAVFSTAAPNEALATQMPAGYIMPAFLYSGYSWPHLAMDPVGLVINAFMPLTYAANDLRDIMLAGYTPFLYRDTAILLTAGTVFIGVSIFVFAWRRKRGGRYVAELNKA